MHNRRLFVALFFCLVALQACGPRGPVFSPDDVVVRGFDDGRTCFIKGEKDTRLTGVVKKYQKKLNDKGELVDDLTLPEQETGYRDGVLHGMDRRYYGDGKTVSYETVYDQGEAMVMREYYTDGQLRRERVRKPKGGGWEKRYAETGKLVYQEPYNENGKLDGALLYESEAGAPLAEARYKNGKPHGKSRTYYVDGTLASEVEYRNGELHGVKRNYHPNGRLQSVERYAEGKAIGLRQSYFNNGRLQEETSFVNGKKQGLHRQFDRNGRLREETPYVNDKKQGLSRCYDDRGECTEVTFVMGEIRGPRRTYSAQTKRLIRELSYNGNEKDGWERLYFEENGALLSECAYKNGKRIGTCRAYWPDGTLRRLIVTEDGGGYIRKNYSQDGTLQEEVRYDANDRRVASPDLRRKTGVLKTRRSKK